MAMPRTPKAKAEVSGQASKNPQRFGPRVEPKATALGNPPGWMTREQVDAWNQFAFELPWLAGADRSLVEVAAVIRARLVIDPVNVGVQALNLLRQCLGQMGATPADRTKVAAPDAPTADPDDAFFARPN